MPAIKRANTKNGSTLRFMHDIMWSRFSYKHSSLMESRVHLHRNSIPPMNTNSAGIFVNIISPNMVMTSPMVSHAPSERSKKIKDSIIFLLWLSGWFYMSKT